jgi:hypothetical protein
VCDAVYLPFYLIVVLWFFVISMEQHWKMTLAAAYRGSIQKEVISDLKAENQFLSKELWGSGVYMIDP